MKALSIVFLIVIMMNLVVSQGLSSSSSGVTITTLSGNFTNLSQMDDTNIPSPTNGQFLTYHSATAKWIASTAAAFSKWIVDTSNGYLYNDTDTIYFNETVLNNTIDSRAVTTETDPIYNSENSTIARIGDCPSGQLVQNITTGGVECSSAGAGDITSVQGDDLYIYNGSNSGDVVLVLNETKLNETIDDRDTDTTYTNGSNLSLVGTTFALNTVSVLNWLNNIFIPLSDEGNLNVNSSDYWDELDTINSTQLEDISGVLNIKESWFTTLWNAIFATKTTDDLTEGSNNLYDNKSWNESYANDLYVNTDGDTMTGDLNFSNSAIKDPSYVQFNITYTDGKAEGRLQWNSDDGTLEVGMPGGDVNLQIGQEQLIRATNREGSQINNCQPVYISGSSGGFAEVKISGTELPFRTAQATVGFATEDILNNQKGYINTFGIVRGCNTSAFSDGDAIYLGSNGTLMTMPSNPPNASIFLGIAITSHATEGIISNLIDVQPLLTDLSDISNGQINNSILTWNNDTGVWEPTNTPTFNNVTVLNSIIQNGYKLKNISSNDNIIGDIFSIEMNGTTGIDLPHMYVQPGGPGQFSGMVRSWGIVDETEAFLNNTNRTDCQTYFNSIGETLKIDCNTTTTGADFFVSDDFQVVGDVWVKDTEGSWHFLTRSMDLQDRLFSDLLLNEVNSTLDGTNMTIVESRGETLIVNIDSNETITEKTQDSVTIVEGTNITPVKNFIYYADKENPTLTRSATEPTDDNAAISQLIQGSGYTYASVIDEQSEEKAIRRIFDRFYSQGPLYESGYNQDATATNINFTGGNMILITHEDISTNILDTDTGYFYIEDGTDYIQLTGLDGIDEYSDGTPISNNKYFNVVFGVIHNDLENQSNRMIAVIQDGTSEYTTLSGAEIDTSRLSNFFVADNLLNKMYIPIARVVMQRTGGSTNTIQTLSTGNNFIDIRGVTSSAGGASGSPTITDHSLLDNLDYDSSGHTGFLADTYNDLFNFTNGPGYWNDSYATFNKSYADTLYYSITNPSGFYNASDFVITDYFTKSDILGFSYYNASDFDINDYYLASNPSRYWNDTYATFNKSYADTLYAAIGTEDNSSWNQSYADTLYYSIENPSGFYNSSDFSISDYFTKSDVLGFGYYNSSDFNIADYSTTAQANGLYYSITNPSGFYNASNFVISDYFTKSDVLGFGYYNSSNFDIADYSTTAQANALYYGIGNPSEFYNASDFLISDYFTKSDVLGFGYYNSSDFDINDYYLKSNPSKYWNDTWAGFNKTYADTLYAPIAIDGTVTSITAGNGLDFSEITGSGAVTMGTPSTLTSSTTNAVTSTSHTHQVDESGFSIGASQITAGTFGTGNYVMDTNLTVQSLVLENDALHRIEDNSTCTKIYGDTSVLEIC